MAKLYVNGYREPKFEVKDTDGNTVYSALMSFKYEAFKEYYERITTPHEYTDGSKNKKSHFIRYEWRLFYVSRIDNPDFLKIKEIENADIARDVHGYQIWLTPHMDAPQRKFRVMTADEVREYEIFPHFDGLDNTPMRGIEISFVNMDPIVTIDIYDPNGVEATFGGEHHPHTGQMEE